MLIYGNTRICEVRNCYLYLLFRFIYLPDLGIGCIAQFLDDVYNGLCNDDEFLLDVSQDLARCLGMLIQSNDTDEIETEFIITEEQPDEASTIHTVSFDHGYVQRNLGN